MRKLNAIIILDGFGINKDKQGNAIVAEGTPYINSLMAKYPWTTIGASGLDVGLPDGQMGNSEVGHLNIGAGRIVYQELTKITKAIEEGDFFKNEAFLKAINNAKENNKALHLMGLLSDGGVHSHNSHLYALLKLAKMHKLEKVYVHCFMDGRDVSPTSGINFIKELEDMMKEIGVGKIATVMGRYYAMDRDNRWDRVEKAYKAMAESEGEKSSNILETIQTSYDNNVTDEFILPTVLMENDKPVAKVEKGDSMIFFNFRPDRAREITRTFIYEDFDKFVRPSGFVAPKFVSFTQYDETFTGLDIAFPLHPLVNTFGEFLAKNNKTQLRIAETEKYAHVTFFFNGNVEEPNKGEDRVLINSPKVATYDLQPEMSAIEVADKAVDLIKQEKYDVMILNFANCDMVGHTGIFDAAVKAVEAVDEQLKKVIDAIQSIGGCAIVTADHGNADKMMNEDGSPFTAHTTNPVPMIIVDDSRLDAKLSTQGKLSDLAPTLIDMMGMEQPKEMTGKSLIIK